jgi:beta-N-acetylhexosaminidase
MMLGRGDPMSQVGQLVMVGLDQPRVPEGLGRLLRRHPLGGVFLFGAALGAEAETAALTADAQAASRLPMLIAVDQEGGRLQEWGPPHRDPLPRAADLGAQFATSGDPDVVLTVARRVGRELRAGGINVDFAPVLDVHTNPDNPIIGDRSFGSDPQLVGEVGVLFIEGLHEQRVVACGKHFPGHGDTAQDSHLALPTVSHDAARLQRVELAPFVRSIAAGLQMIMTAHVLYPALDRQRPATVSPAILHNLLRERLGFDGVVITDDLKMQGIRDEYDLLEGGVAAIEAGCDLLLTATEFERHEALLEGLEKAERDGRLSAHRVAESVARVERLRRWAA